MRRVINSSSISAILKLKKYLKKTSRNLFKFLPAKLGFKEEGIFTRRLLRKPVFIFSSVRSGSTLLSSILNAHSEIYSPNETQFSALTVQQVKKFESLNSINRGLEDFGLNLQDAKYLMWDTILARALEKSGKDVIVEKTPRTVLDWEDVVECWPDTKIIFLLRHPYSIAQSWMDAKQFSTERAYGTVLEFVDAIEDARKHAKQDSITVKYEDITSNPVDVMKRICDFLGVKFEPSMLDYGSSKHNKNTKKTIGDRGKKMKSGMIQSGRELPRENEVPEELRKAAAAWGYL